MATTPDQARVDFFAPQLLADPYPWYAQIREAGIAYFSPPNAPNDVVPVIGRYRDVQFALRDPRFGRAGFKKGAELALGDGPLSQAFAQWMLFRDPPDHTRLRGLVNKAFTPRAVEALRTHIEAIVQGLIERQRGQPSFDLIGQFAHPLPVLVICELLGVPEADRDHFGAWSTAIAQSLDNLGLSEPDTIRRGNEAAAGLTEYFRGLIRSRRGAPVDDILNGLLAAEEQGDRLSEGELLATCLLIFFAGHETTVNLIGNGALALLRNPDQLQRVRDNPALMPSAVEELLRFDSPVQRTVRSIMGDVEMCGQQFHQGDRVNILIGAANRDPAQFAEPDRLDITRANASQHLAFGVGIHYCLGAALARLEAQLALGALLRHAPRLRLATDKPAWRATFVLRGLAALPVAVS